jgi:hypothetical protein
MHEAATCVPNRSANGDTGPPNASAARRRTSATAHGPSTTGYSPGSTATGDPPSAKSASASAASTPASSSPGRTDAAVSSSDRPGVPCRRTRRSPKLRDSNARTPRVDAIAVDAAAARQLLHSSSAGGSIDTTAGSKPSCSRPAPGSGRSPRAAGPDCASRAAVAAAPASPASSTSVVTAVPTRPPASTTISAHSASVVTARPAPALS